ncbi:MAG: 4Fe-4S dicluster domain-containing protein [Ignavibacteria bacterium]|jgi:Fe-S-cluster-containing dehydrogenase component/anaerobic selenocysteine-containing dehydrogenase
MSDRSLHASNSTPWKSIDGLAQGTSESSEFAPGTTTNAITDSTVSRRGFMALVSASMALTAAACRRPEQKLVPSVKSLQNATPGLPMYYASVYAHRNVAYGAVIKTREGRPIKVKGNEQHPVNCGTANAEMQASLLSLYDPDRIRRAKIEGSQVTYDAAVSKISTAIGEAQSAGKKTVIFIDEHCSPSYTQLLNDFVASVPSASVVYLPAISHDSSALAARAVIGVDGQIVPDLGKASVIVSVESDFLGTDPLAVYHTGRFAARRTPSKEQPSMSHLTVVESTYSTTGMNADVRVRTSPSDIETFITELLSAVKGGASSNKQAASAAARLKKAGTSGVVLAGPHLSPKAQALAMLVNLELGCVGDDNILDPKNTLPNSGEKATALNAAMAEIEAGNVHVALFMDVNPEYSASRAIKSALVKKVKVRAAVNLYEDETAAICDVSIPAAHWLESWGTAVAFDGTFSVQQPMIAPMCDGIPSMQDTLIAVGKKLNAAFLGETATYSDYVKSMVAAVYPTATWNQVLQDGIIAAGSRTSLILGVDLDAPGKLAGAQTSDLYMLTLPSSALYDGKYANNGWLQELPDPVTKVTWDNVALISPKKAEELGLTTDRNDPGALVKANERVITITTQNGSIELPVLVQPGLADNVIVTQLGYGRASAGTIGNNVGANAFTLGTPGYIALRSGSVTVTDERRKVATTQNHHSLSEKPGDEENARNVARSLKLSDISKGNFEGVDNEYISEGKDGRYNKPLSIVNEYEYKGHRWGMVIDMSACTGCSSCIVACQSENNIPVVGKQQVALGREMHWIRLDRYYTGSVDEPTGAILEPMLCQHCENAPCENVCPVAATTHSPEGLNEMTYNRCVGTRYCLNNCPYKVRRFNFLNYKDERQPLDLVFNPEVSGRMRGIMEKCTFCVQRLHEAKWHARDNGRSRILDGEAVTACQEACPASAIIFGDMNDAKSRVAVARQNERGFHVLAEINTRPSVTYLAKVVNDVA